MAGLMPQVTSSLVYVGRQFVKTVVGDAFYQECTTDTHIRALLNFCTQDVEQTKQLMERIKIVNHKNAQKGTAQFVRREMQLINTHIQRINVALSNVTSATLNQLEELDHLRTNVVLAFERSNYAAVDRALTDMLRVIQLTMDHTPKPRMNTRQLAAWASVKILQVHFALLSMNLKDHTTTTVPQMAGFLRGFGMSSSMVQRLIPVLSTGLIGAGTRKPYAVTSLYTEHPWDALVSWVSLGAGYTAGLSSSAATKFAMASSLMAPLRFGTGVFMILMFYLLAVSLRKKQISSNTGYLMGQGVTIVQRALVASHTSIQSVYARATQHVIQHDMHGYTRHTSLGPLHRKELERTYSAGSVGSHGSHGSHGSAHDSAYSMELRPRSYQKY